LISSPKVSDASKIRLVQLYSLRYEKFQGNAVASLIDLLYKNGLGEREISVSPVLFISWTFGFVSMIVC
jgi:vacuolar protein sorting-associated protein 45